MRTLVCSMCFSSHGLKPSLLSSGAYTISTSENMASRRNSMAKEISHPRIACLQQLWDHCSYLYTSRESIYWIVPMIESSFFPMDAVLLFNAILNYQADAYPQYVKVQNCEERTNI
ncbi:hypothetical protein E4T50_08823 [Aureobasidium sp. EXF-12298]|nr:hypothetical protein E4T50_08823 [Aureobasidium sp. EXF-12298]KAI4755707.1 hypothetical protein E4T51_11199 [Aureobasidium sp. EXF-12344]KAI4772797.1 hypothetical protein E4T52_12226 [Aureobasidium sp. EXF-3400]